MKQKIEPPAQKSAKQRWLEEVYGPAVKRHPERRRRFSTLSDDPLSRGEVGREGVAVDTLRDMEILFDRIPLDLVTTSMTINGPASIVWAMYLAAAEKRAIPLDRLGGTIQNDALKEYIAQREWIVPVKPAMSLVVDTFRFGSREEPRWNTISISGYHIREAGATAVQELAFTLIDGLEYVKWGVDAGLDVND